jgi:pyruvate/2-oxoglutarate dehydrogenase complex dihydrolipoamide dehydrogenase (E3) component
VLILGAGRRPDTTGLGLDTVGIQPDGRGATPVYERCRAGDGLWALGDVTGVALFTHVAMYQGRVVADNILGRDRTAWRVPCWSSGRAGGPVRRAVSAGVPGTSGSGGPGIRGG